MPKYKILYLKESKYVMKQGKIAIFSNKAKAGNAVMEFIGGISALQVGGTREKDSNIGQFLVTPSPTSIKCVGIPSPNPVDRSSGKKVAITPGSRRDKHLKKISKSHKKKVKFYNSRLGRWVFNSLYLETSNSKDIAWMDSSYTPLDFDINEIKNISKDSYVDVCKLIKSQFAIIEI